MKTDVTEEKFYGILKDIGLDLQYIEFCRERRKRPIGEPIELRAVKECIERLPIPFRYVKSERFFQYQEKIDEVTLLLHFSIRDSLLTPMIYLETEDYAYGMPLAMLTLRLVRSREEMQAPPPSQLALRFSGIDDLFAVLEFSTLLFLQTRAAVQAAVPWRP